MPPCKKQKIMVPTLPIKTEPPLDDDSTELGHITAIPLKRESSHSDESTFDSELRSQDPQPQTAIRVHHLQCSDPEGLTIDLKIETVSSPDAPEMQVKIDYVMHPTFPNDVEYRQFEGEAMSWPRYFTPGLQIGYSIRNSQDEELKAKRRNKLPGNVARELWKPPEMFRFHRPSYPQWIQAELWYEDVLIASLNCGSPGCEAAMDSRPVDMQMPVEIHDENPLMGSEIPAIEQETPQMPRSSELQHVAQSPPQQAPSSEIELPIFNSARVLEFQRLRGAAENTERADIRRSKAVGERGGLDDLQIHETTRTRSRLHKCDCGKGFVYVSQLNEHKRTHTSEKPHKCESEGCGKAFRRLRDLQVHKRSHTGERLYKCDEADCGKGFMKETHLDEHKLTHRGEKPHRCDAEECGRAFGRQRDLQVHQRSHTGEKLHRCDEVGCEKAFVKETHLNEHKMIHSSDRPYKCNRADCGKAFARKSCLTRHGKIHDRGDTI